MHRLENFQILLMIFKAVNKIRLQRLLISGVLFFGISPLACAAFVTNLSEAKIQNVLANYFPFSEYAAFARVSLQAPKVRLQSKNKNLVLIIPITANVAGGSALHGQVTMQVSLTYKPPTGSLYLSEPNIQRVEISDADDEMLSALRKIVDSMGQNSLPIVRIYTVKERDLNHSLSKSTLKSSSIEDGQLRLEFGFN